MTSYFRQIVFPQKPKPVVVAPTSSVGVMTETKARAMFETVYCSKKDGWFSMIECINCPMANRTLEEIMEDGIGCMGAD